MMTDSALRRGLYVMSLLTLLLPPFVGGTIMGLVGIYPLPEFFFIFGSYTGLYVLCVLIVLALITSRMSGFIINIPLQVSDELDVNARRFLKLFPWYLLTFLILYAFGGAITTNISLEAMGIGKYDQDGYLFTMLGIITAVLVTVFPIYFFYTDYIGRYLAPRGVHVVASPMSIKLVLLGLVTPTLIDSMLIVYFYKRTQYFETDTMVMWGILIVLAGAGTYIALKSFRYGIKPLQDYIGSNDMTTTLEQGQLVSRSLDEFGVLTARLKDQMESVLELKAQLDRNAQLGKSLLRLSRALEQSRTFEDIAEVLRVEIARVTPYEESWLLLAEEDDRYFYPVAVTGENIESSIEHPQIQRLDMFRDPFLRDLHMAMDAVVVEDMRADPRTDKKLVEFAGHCTTIHVPVIIAGKRVGIFGTGSFVTDGVIVPSMEIVNYLVTMANHVAAAVDRVKFIQERESIYLALEQEKKFGNAIIENAGALVVVLDSEGKICRFNRACEQLTGYSFTELEGEYVWDHLLIPEERDLVRENAFRMLAEDPKKMHGNYLNHWVTRSGEKKLIEWSNTVLMNQQGKMEYVIALGIDVTEKKAAEEELARSKETYSRAEAIAHIGSWDWDILTNDLYWTDEIYRIFGLTPQSFSATYPAFLEAIHPDDRQVVIDAVNISVSDTSKPYAVEHRVVRPDGEIRHVYERGKVYCDESDKPVRMIGTVHDITEQKISDQELQHYRDHLEDLVRDRTRELEQAKEAAETANRAKSDFLSHMSHELRTPMNAILGFSQLLELEPLNGVQMDYTNEIHRAGSHLFDLITELLDLSRIEMGKLEIVLKPQKIDSIVDHAVQMVGVLAHENELSLTNHCGEDISVLADETRLKQILMNYFTNAIKYNRKGGSINISCKKAQNNMLRIIVRDTGIGIPEENLHDLFKPFERLGAENTGIDGTGIGLALSKKLADLMGAELGVESILGEGTSFWIDVPIADDVARNSDVSVYEEVAGDANSQTVLYIEDNPANLKLVESMFKHYPHLTIISAMNGQSGIDLAKRTLPDVILLDIHLPCMDGFQVLSELQGDEKTHMIPVIALTADAMPLDIERGLNAGFTSYVTKPVRMNELMSAIDAVIRRKPD